MIPTTFKVMVISKASNDLGLHGVIIANADGLVFDVSVPEKSLPALGEIVTGRISVIDHLLWLPFYYTKGRRLTIYDIQSLN